MLILITGSRTWHDDLYVWRTLDGLLANAEDGLMLHHGHCPKGADAAADAWGFTRQSEGKPVTVVRYPAKWHDDNGQLDRRAGFRRNAEMVKTVAAASGSKEVHAFVRSHSPGTTHCANRAVEAGLKVIRHRWEER